MLNELAYPSSEISLRSALNTIILLGNEGSNHLCTLLSREGGVKGLIAHCLAAGGSQANGELVDPIRAETRILALRGLSSICCVAECIREFEHVRKQGNQLVIFWILTF